MKRTTARIGFYGTTAIPRAYCNSCRGMALIIKGRFACCNEPVVIERITGSKRMSDVPIGRDRPSKKRQIELLNEQDHRCLYCSRRFGAIVYRKDRAIKLRLQWDHKLPYCYSMDNRPDNFAAACHICNGIKSGFIYNSIEEAKIAIAERWKTKGYSDEGMRSLPSRVSPETPLAEVLLR